MKVKNLALLDIRFARTINRIQKSIVQELNKIAIIHLYVLGFEDELDNFSLGLSNPSSQADLLKIEQWKEKITLYKDAVTDPGNGLQAVSSTWAKKYILGMSDEEIKLDLQQQRFEKALSGELAKTEEIIKKTGVFNTVDKLYGEPPTTEGEAAAEGTESAEAGLDMTMDMGGDEDIGADMGGEEGGTEVETEPAAAAEGFNVEKGIPLLMENKGLNLKDLDVVMKKTNKNIDEINKEVESLLKD